MRLGLLVTLTLVLLAAACEGPPPTQIVLVVTATPPEQTTEPQSVNTVESQAPTANPALVAATNTPATTPTIDPFPTPTIGQIQVAEQQFEHGRMFWIQPRKQIWVIYDDGSGSGKWEIYEDTFQDGEMESDPSIVPPPGQYQPERGFGKLWRETPGVRDRLGFGIIPEYGYVSNYEYHPGGTVQNGQYIPGPGYHILFSLYQDKFQFNEADGTWKKIS
jgi:hypothetical protein